MTRSGAHDARPGGRPATGGRFGLLLLVLILTYLLSAFTKGRWVSALQIALFVATALLALRTSALPRRMSRAVIVITLTGSAAAAGVALTQGTGIGQGAANIWSGLVQLLAAVLIVRRVLTQGTVTVQSIYGALSAYLIIGLMFAAFYAAINHLGGADFFSHGKPADTQTFQYFSFTTLTTLGYGDFTAAANGGRAVAVVEALTGQVFLATLVARLVTAFRAPAEPLRHPAGKRQRSAAGHDGRAAIDRYGTVISHHRGARRHPRDRRAGPGAGTSAKER